MYVVWLGLWLYFHFLVILKDILNFPILRLLKYKKQNESKQNKNSKTENVIKELNLRN